jgi:hypothetical protein
MSAFEYRCGKGLCVVFSQHQASFGVEKDVERIRQMCLVCGIEFKEEADLTAAGLLMAHGRLRDWFANGDYSFLLKIVLAEGGFDNWREQYFFTASSEYVNVKRDFLPHYTIDQFPTLRQVPDVTILQLYPARQDRVIVKSSSWAARFEPCNVLGHVDKVLWYCVAPAEEARRLDGSSFVREMCDTMGAYPDTNLALLSHCVNFELDKQGANPAVISNNLRSDFVISDNK